jgi:Zinc-finger double-stranded RNA-binding/Zinc finger, C2H2 type
MDILIQGRLLKDANMDQVLERLGKTKQQLLGEQSTAVNAYPSRDVRLEIPVNVEKWWYCTQCTARLDRINLMLKHETNVHGKPTADQRCPDCMRVCGTQKALQQHLNECHNYKCPFCPKMFKWISLLHQHGKDCRHYKCPVCPKTFDEMSLFQDHERSHLKDRPFSCPTCNNTFEREIDFREHQNFHPVDRPFACSICPKLYKTGPVLKNHQKMHLQDRQVSCSICQRTFSGTDTFRRHEKSKIHLQNIREQSSLGDGQERSTIQASNMKKRQYRTKAGLL